MGILLGIILSFLIGSVLVSIAIWTPY